MKKNVAILRALLRDRFRNDLAYIGNFWFELSSTFFYVLTFLLFTQLLFSRVGSIGVYTKDDFLFMALIGQFSFYVWSQIHFASMAKLVENVRTGNFDFLLLRPISSKFYSLVSATKPLYALFVSVPNIVLFIFVINWSNISITASSFVFGVLVWIAGMIMLLAVMMLLAMPVFTQGDATDMVQVSYSLFSMTELPYNLLPGSMKILSFTLVPTILATAGSAYVMLNKGDTTYIITGALCAGLAGILCFNILWKKALANYSSASS